MRKLYLFPIFLLFCFSFSLSSTVYGCRPIGSRSAQTLVSNAEFILRATANKYIREPRGNIRALNEPDDTEIEFRVEEVLKGEKVPSTLVLNGYLTDRDDYNEQVVPYSFVRKGGRGGSCSAYEYKKGAEYLLFLVKKDGKLTVNWYPLAPTNEQLRSKDDDWIIWVKNNLQNSKETNKNNN